MLPKYNINIMGPFLVYIVKFLCVFINSYVLVMYYSKTAQHMTAETIRRPWRELNPVYTKQPVVKRLNKRLNKRLFNRWAV